MCYVLSAVHIFYAFDFFYIIDWKWKFSIETYKLN